MPVTGVLTMTYMTIEHAARNAWPSITEKQLPYGVLRFAHGYTKRANSMNLYSAQQVDGVRLVRDCEEFFADYRQPSIIRMPSFTCPGRLDRFLEHSGYDEAEPSQVMTCQLSHIHQAAVHPLRLESHNWLDAYYQASGENAVKREVHEQLLLKICGEPFFACMENASGDPVCCAIGILYNNVLGIFSVVTDPAHQKRQFATLTINALLSWGRERKATHAFLQVDESNMSAINLYMKLGFRKFYRYWYRIRVCDGI